MKKVLALIKNFIEGERKRYGTLRNVFVKLDLTTRMRTNNFWKG